MALDSELAAQRQVWKDMRDLRCQIILGTAPACHSRLRARLLREELSAISRLGNGLDNASIEGSKPLDRREEGAGGSAWKAASKPYGL